MPAYQEAQNLDALLPKLSESAGRLTDRFEILVVDTQTPLDETPEVCARHGARYLPRAGGDRYGDAVRTGISRSTGRYVILMDADGSHNPGFLPKLWEHRTEADVVVASRYIKGGQTDNPAILIFMSLLVNVVFRVVIGLKCLDVSNSFRLYDGDTLRKLDLECPNFDIVEEILVKLSFSKKDFLVKEVPFRFEQRKAGKTKRKLFLFMLSYLAVLYRLCKLKRAAAHQP